jgi:hypothetical protein
MNERYIKWYTPSLSREFEMARPRVELLARHAAVLFVGLMNIERSCSGHVRTAQFVIPSEVSRSEMQSRNL